MTQEDKDLLFKDLCARLPYGVKIQVNDKIETVEGINILDNIVEFGTYMACDIDEVKPYLFPMSSMTEEQKKELRQMDAFINTFGNICFAVYDEYGHDIVPTYEDSIRITNWLNKNMFDWRGLIPKGLANDATGKNIY